MAVSHAERIAKRHARQVAANANTPASVAPAPVPGPISPARGEWVGPVDADTVGRVAPAGDGPRDEPGATGDEEEALNPFAQFMGCAP